MATFTKIPEKTQTATAMRRVLDYVMQDKKTVLDGIKLVSGQNCVPESAYQEFMATKHQYGKANGVFFKQYVQSFKPDCNATPEQIHRIGLELAKAFDGFEVVVATHIDRDHWHNHLVVNSVNCETGLKIQTNEKGLEQLRNRSDEICQRFGLEVLKPYQKPKQKSLNQREYRAALCGNRKKLKLTNAIDYAVAISRSKKQFVEQMNKLGYGVKWIEHYKYITYTTPDGQRFWDNRLLDNKYLKTNMEELFAYKYGAVKTDQQNRTDNRADSSSLDRTDTADVSSAQAGTVQFNSPDDISDWTSHCAKYGFDIRVADTSGFERPDRTDASPECFRDTGNRRPQDGLDELFRRGKIIEADGSLGENARQETVADDDGDESERFDAVEAQTEMDIDWSNIAVNATYLAADLQMMFGCTDDKKRRKRKLSVSANTDRRKKKLKVRALTLR